MERNEKQIRKLREQADKARQAGNTRKALDLYHDLCGADPAEPRWPQLCGELHRKLGQIDASIEHFVTAARLYKDQGFDVKAVAMCKVLLALDPLNAMGLTLLEEITAAPRIRADSLVTPAITSASSLPATTPVPSSPGAYGAAARIPAPVPGAGPTAFMTPPMPSAFSAGGPTPAPLSTPSPPTSTQAARRGPRETSPKELQSLDLAELEMLLQSPEAVLRGIEAPRATPPTPSPGVGTGAPTAPHGSWNVQPSARSEPSVGSTLDLAIEIEGYDSVLGAAPLSVPPPPTGTSWPGDQSASSPGTRSVHETLTLSEDELEILDVVEELDDVELVVVEPSGPPFQPYRRSQPLAPSERELEILDESDLAFMEALEKSTLGEERAPKKRPTLTANAPLETLELRDVMPGRERLPSHPHMEDLYEITLDEPETEPEPEVSPAPPQGLTADDYERRITPAKAPPDMTPPGLFRALGIDATKSLVTRMSYVEKQPGEVVIRQGEVGGSLYVIVRGEVRIVREMGAERVEISRLSDGEFFGEMALVTDTPRVATVEAVTELDLLEVSRETLRLLIQDFPQIVPNLIKFLKDRLLEVFVKTSELLGPVPEKYRWQLARKFKLYEVPQGRVILKEGKPSGGMFIFLAGHATVTRQRRGKTLRISELGPGALIGEISLLTGGAAVATVTASTKCWLLAISQKQFDVLCQSFPRMRHFVEKVADERRAENAQILSAETGFVSQELRLV